MQIGTRHLCDVAIVLSRSLALSFVRSHTLAHSLAFSHSHVLESSGFLWKEGGENSKGGRGREKGADLQPEISNSNA